MAAELLRCLRTPQPHPATLTSLAAQPCVQNCTERHPAYQQPEERLMRISKAVAVTLFFFALAARPSAQPPPGGRFVAGEILVKFKPGANASAKADAHRLAGGSPLDQMLSTPGPRASVPGGTENAPLAPAPPTPEHVYPPPRLLRRA